MDLRLEPFLTGRSSKLSLRYLGYSVILMALFFGQLYLAGNSEMGNAFTSLVTPPGVAVLAVVLAGVHTYRNDGILVSIAVAVVIVSGYSLYGAISLTHPRPDYGFLTGVGTAILYGVPVGIISATLAYALRRFSPGNRQ